MNSDYFWKERRVFAVRKRQRECEREKEYEGGILKLPRNLRGIHTWDKHCELRGLSPRHLTGTCFIAEVEAEGRIGTFIR